MRSPLLAQMLCGLGIGAILLSACNGSLGSPGVPGQGTETAARHRWPAPGCTFPPDVRSATCEADTSIVFSNGDSAPIALATFTPNQCPWTLGSPEPTTPPSAILPNQSTNQIPLDFDDVNCSNASAQGDDTWQATYGTNLSEPSTECSFVVDLVKEYFAYILIGKIVNGSQTACTVTETTDYWLFKYLPLSSQRKHHSLRTFK